jgi:hypothetical protein
MESTSGDILLNTFSEVIKSYNLHPLILKITSKSSTKKQLLQQIKDSMQNSNLVVYIECLEEWPQELICFIFEYLIDQSFKTSFVVDISTDPRFLSQTLDASILQKITVEQFYYPEFSGITSEVLWNLTQKCNFPVMSSKIFSALSECRSEAKFMKILKSSLLKFFNDKVERREIFLERNGNEELINLKDYWTELLQAFIRMAETPPMRFEIRVEDLHRSIYELNKKDDQASLVTDFIGSFDLKPFDVYENYDEFMVGLCEKCILSEDEVNVLRRDFLNLEPHATASWEISSKCKKWRLSFFMPKLRMKIINSLKPLDEVAKRLGNSENYILNICDFIDSDLMKITIQQLHFSNLGLNGDMQILFRIIKGKGRHLKLNQIFDEF